MAASQDILLTWKTDTGEVTKSLSEITAGIDAIDSKVTDTTKNTSKMGTGLKTAGQTGASGFKALGTAIKATGIGLLIAGIAMLISKMAENKKIAEKLELVMSGIGAVFNQLVELVAPLGDVISAAFSNPMETIKNIGTAIKENLLNRFNGMLELIPAVGKAIGLALKGKFSEAGKVAADAMGKVVLGVEDITDKVAATVEAVVEFGTTFVAEAKKSVAASTALTKAQQKLRDQQRGLNVEYAQARAKIEQLKKARDDERLSIEDRIAAAQEASELDQEFADKREAIANREVELVQREIALQGETVERLDTLAEARIAAAEAAESSAAVQTELMTSIIGLQNEQIVNEQELIDKEQERIQNLIDHQKEIDKIIESARSQDLIALQEWYDEKKLLVDSNEAILTGLDEAHRIKKQEINDKYDAEELAKDKTVADSKLQMAQLAMNALTTLNAAFAYGSEKAQKQQFKRNKALAYGSAIVNTALAVTDALAKDGVGPGTRFLSAIAAGAVGVAQVAAISRTRFKSGGSPPPGPSGGGGGASGPPTPTSPQLDLSFLGGGAGQDGFRTYVIASEVSNSQQANQRINDQAALVG